MKLILHYMKRYKWLVLLNILSVFGFALVELGIPTMGCCGRTRGICCKAAR